MLPLVALQNLTFYLWHCDTWFLDQQKTKVVLNGQCSSWVDIQAGVPRDSIFGPLLFLIYVNDLPDGLKSECKLFADDTSLFSVVHDIGTSASDTIMT